jgi:hypothetical protein
MLITLNGSGHDDQIEQRNGGRPRDGYRHWIPGAPRTLVIRRNIEVLQRGPKFRQRCGVIPCESSPSVHDVVVAQVAGRRNSLVFLALATADRPVRTAARPRGRGMAFAFERKAAGMG